MDNSCDTSVEEGSIRHAPLGPVHEHKELNSQETGDVLEHDRRLVADTATHGNGEIEDTEAGCVRTEQLLYKNGVVMCGLESIDGKCDSVENKALPEKDDDVAGTHGCLSLEVMVVSKSVDDVSSQDVSCNRPDKLCINEMVDNIPSVEKTDIKGQNCDILGDNSIEMGGCEHSSPLLAPLSTDVTVCAGMKMTSNGSVCLVEKSVEQENGEQIDSEAAESPSLDPSSNHESRQNYSRYEPNVSEISLDDNVFEGVKETSNPESDQENGQMNAETAESRSLYCSVVNESTKNSSCYEANVSEVSLDDNVFETLKETSQLESDQEHRVKTMNSVCNTSSLVHSDKEKNMHSLVGDEDNIANVTFDDNISFVENETLKQESDHENSIQTVSCRSNSSSLVHSDKEKNMHSLVGDEDNIANVTFDDNISFVENETLKQESDHENSIQTVSCRSNSSSLVDLDKAGEDNTTPAVTFDDSVSLVESESSKLADDQHDVQSDRCISSSPDSLDNIPETVKCQEMGLLKHKFGDREFPIDGESLKKHELLNQGTQKIDSDLQGSVFMKCEHSVSLETRDHFKKQEGMETNSQRIVPELVEGKSSSIGIEVELSESLMTVNKTASSDSLDKDLSDIQMTGVKTVRCGSVEENQPQSLMTSSWILQSAAVEVDQPESGKTVCEMLHSESSEEDFIQSSASVEVDQPESGKIFRKSEQDELEVLTKVNLTVHSDSSGEDITDVNKTVHSDSSGEDITDVNKTVHSDISGEDITDVNTTVHSDSSGEDITDVNTTVHSDSSGEDITDVNKTVHSDSSGEDITDVNKTVHSDSSGEDITDVNKTVHSDSSGEDITDVNTTVHSDSSGEDITDVNKTVHSDSSGEGITDVNTTVHSDCEDVAGVLSKVNSTVHSDSSGEGIPEVDMTVHSDSSGDDIPEVNSTVHSDSSGDDIPEVNSTVHSDSSGDDILEVNMTVHSDSSGEGVLKSSVTPSKLVQSTTIKVDISESLGTVRKTVHSDSSEEDDPEMLRKFRKTAPLGRMQRDILETRKLVDQAAESDSLEESQSEARWLFVKTAHPDDAGAGICELLKKSDKKAMSKKKKRTKEKKGHRKKRKQESDLVSENVRFVEVSREKYSAGGLRVDEMEVEGRNVIYNRRSNERMLVETYEELLDQEAGFQPIVGLKELGDIEYIKERKKKGKKKKKKRKRRVATVEEGDGEDNASHQFPTYLDGFFLQYNEGNDDLDDASLALGIQPRMLDKEDQIHQRHFSRESDDFVQSDNCSDTVKIRREESRRRRHDKREHKERKRKQKQRSHSHEALYEREHHEVTISARRQYACERDRSETHEERVRSSDRKIRRVDREHVRERVMPGIEHVRETMIPDRDRRRVEVAEERRHSARSCSQDYRTVIAERSPVHSSQHQRRSESRGAVNETGRERGLGRAKHKDQHDTRRMSHKRNRHAGNSHVAGSQRRPERGSDKENSWSRKRRRPMRAQDSGDSNYRGRIRNMRRVHRRGASMSSCTSINSDGAVRRRDDDSDDGYCIIISQENSEDDGASSDVILVESERIIINLDEEEDPPPRVGITRGRRQPAVANNARESAVANNAREPAVANNAREPAVANKARESAVANKARESAVANKGTEPVIAKKGTEPAIAKKGTEPVIAKKGTEPVIAKKGTEPAIAKKGTEPVIAKKGTEPVIAKKGTEPAIAKKGTEPVIAKKGTEPAIAKKGTEPAIAKKGTEPAIAKTATEPAIAKKGTEPVITKKGTEPTIAKKGTEPTIAKKGTEPAIANKAREPTIAKKGTEPAIAKKGTEPAIAKKGTEPAIAKKGTEPAVAKKGTEPAIAKKTNSKSVHPPLEQSISLSRTIQTSNSPKRHENVRDVSKRECRTALTSDQRTIEVETLPSITVSAAYDPMYPTEDAEEHNVRHPAFSPNTPSASPVVGHRPASPDCPAPKECRPSTPPLPVVMKAGTRTSSLLHPSQPSVEEASSSSASVPANHRQFQQQAAVTGHLGIEFEQAPNLSCGSRTSLSPNKQLPNGGLTPGCSVALQNLLPTQDTVPFLPLQNSLLPPSFNSKSVPFLPPPPPPPFGVCLEPAQLPVPAVNQVSPHEYPQPVFDRHHMASHGDEQDIFQPDETCSNQHTKPLSLIETSHLVSSIAADLSSSCSHSSPGHDGGDVDTMHAVDMDFSSADDDYHLELLSPKANSKKDVKRRRQQRQHSSLNQDVSSGNNPGSSSEVSVKPGKSLGKDTKLAPRETLQGTPEKSKVHRGKKKKGENNVREEDEDVPASAADLTCKEKFLRKLYFQERVIEEVKMAIKPFYSSKKITKDQYKVILRKAVPKVCHNKKGNINPQKILHLVEAYVRKMNKGQAGGGGKKHPQVQQRRAGEKHNSKDKNMSASVKHNTDRTFGLVR